MSFAAAFTEATTFCRTPAWSFFLAARSLIRASSPASSPATGSPAARSLLNTIWSTPMFPQPVFTESTIRIRPIAPAQALASMDFAPIRFALEPVNEATGLPPTISSTQVPPLWEPPPTSRLIYLLSILKAEESMVPVNWSPTLTFPLVTKECELTKPLPRAPTAPWPFGRLPCFRGPDPKAIPLTVQPI